MCTCALVTAGGGGGRGLCVNKSNTVSVEVFFLCQCKLNILKFKKKHVLFSIVFHGTLKKEEKVVLSYISNAYISMASGDTRSIL